MGMYKNYSSEALQLLGELLKDLSHNIYYNVRPDAVDERMNDFITVNSNNRWNERGVYQYTLINVNLFCRAKQHNIMPIAKTNKMVNTFLEKLPYNNGRFLFNDPVVVRTCTSDTLGFGYATIQVRCSVNTTDKFITNN